MEVPIIMPDLGVEKTTLSLWFVDESQPVDHGERLIEILAGAATFDISAPASGRLAKRCSLPPDRVHPGEVLGYIRPEASNAGK